MTVDPEFRLTTTRADVSNIRDASKLEGLYDCERRELQNGALQTSGSAASIKTGGTFASAAPSSSRSENESDFPIGVALGGSALLVAMLALFLQGDRCRQMVRQRQIAKRSK